MSPQPPSPTDVDQLAEDIAQTAALIEVATHTLLAKIRRFDELQGWALDGMISCAHWLSWRLGYTLATAREKIRVAHALASLPLIDAAFRQGQLTYSKVRAMTRVATNDNEETLLSTARYATGAQLERICRSYRRVLKADDGFPSTNSTERSKDFGRGLHHHMTASGRVLGDRVHTSASRQHGDLRANSGTPCL